MAVARDPPTGGQRQLEHRLGAGRERVGQRARHQLEPLVERPHRDVLGAGSISSPRVISALVSARINRVSAVRQPDSRRSLIIGRLSPRCSGPRLSWESAMIGTSSSLASSLIWRENSETSSWRDSTLLAGGHQLHVVDDDQPQVVALLEPAGLGPDLHHRHVGRVVDEHRRRGDLGHLAGQPASSRRRSSGRCGCG